MSSLTKVILSFVIIFGFFQLSISKEETDWKTHRLISKKGWSGKTDKFDNPKLVYSLCKNQRTANSKRECMIVQHKDINNDDEKPTECTFTLENALFGIIRIKNFGNDKAIFVWADERKKNKALQWTFHTGLIEMSSCKIVDTGLVFDTDPWQYGPDGWHTFYIGILVFNDTFDICIQKVEACGNAKDSSNCVYTYDSEGKLIGGPITRFSPPSNDQFYMLREIFSSRSSDSKRYLLNIKNNGSMEVSIIKSTGPSNDETVMHSLWNFPMDQNGHDRTNYACDNDLLTMCSCGVSSDKLFCSCLQTDQDGNSKREMDIELKKPSNVVPIAVDMYNIRGGGFFFISFYTDNEKYFYYMYYVNLHGLVVGEPIIVASHTLLCAPQVDSVDLVERDDENYCITVSYIEQDKSLGKVLKTLTKCYTLSSLDSKFNAQTHIEL